MWEEANDEENFTVTKHFKKVNATNHNYYTCNSCDYRLNKLCCCQKSALRIRSKRTTKHRQGAYTSLELINEEVEIGKITLEEGKEQARIILNGPVNGNGEYDYQNSHFTYKENGYILAFDEDLVLQLHPSKIGGAPVDDLNRSNREKDRCRRQVRK